jgi:nitroimidazol reductase NimA-like FMN-containing flavoprotein (pyridoxamine 5'-phosphate oxidase superfamily)
MPVNTEVEGLEELDHETCVGLLASMGIGRLAVAVDDDGPLVVPVNYVLDGDVVVFRSGAGSKLHALWDLPVSFQVDQIDPFHRTGWSVLVRGYASEATAQQAKNLVLEPWAPGERRHWVRIVPRAITGRRIRMADVPWDARGYL